MTETHGSRSLKYLLSGPQWTKFADPSSSIRKRPKGKKALFKVNIQVRDKNQDKNSEFSNPTSVLVTSFLSDLLSTYYIGDFKLLVSR